jgi:zinc protease
MHRSVRRACALAAISVALGVAAACAAPDDLLRTKEARLDNGLRLLTLEDPSASVLSFQVWYDVGSRDEREGITGISHLFEHLMFKGSKTIGPEEHSRLIQAAGGQQNAFTTWDVTVYWETVPPEHLELCARLEAERMSTLRLTAESLKSEREVVKEERRYRVDNQPIGRAVEEMTALAFERHPYHWPTLGWMKDLDAITLEDVKAYYAIHYAPDKATVIVAGPLPHEQVEKVVERYFGKLKRGKKAPALTEVEPEQATERRKVVNAITQLPVVIAGYKVPADRSPDTPALEVASRILSQGQSSRLYEKLVYEDQSALFAGGLTRGSKDPSLFYAFAAVKPGKDRQAVEDSLFAVIERLGHQGPTAEELSKARNQMESELVFGLEEVQGRAEAIGTATLITGDPGAAARRLEQTRAVTAADVQRVISTYLVPQRRTVVWLVPQERSGS